MAGPEAFNAETAAQRHEERRQQFEARTKALRHGDFDWDTPISRDVFNAHFADKFADLNLTPSQISALMAVAVCISIGNLDTMIKLIADALEGSRGDECQR